LTGRKRAIWAIVALLAVYLAIVGQRHVARHDFVLDGVASLAVAVALFLWSTRRGGEEVALWPLNRASGEVQEERAPVCSMRVRRILVLLVAALCAVAFFSLADNQFTTQGLLCWLGAVAVWLLANLNVRRRVAPLRKRVRLFWRELVGERGLMVRCTWITLLLLCILAVSLFFRVYRLDSVPPEAQSDHVEASEDVRSILNGDYMIFFPRNTGREAAQFYLTAALSRVFGYGFSTLKLTMALVGALNVIPMYFLGKELWDKRFGLVAAFFMAISYWHVILSRIGWRVSLMPFWTTATLYWLLRAFHTRRRNDFLWTGVSLGMGLYGYMSFRVVPLLIVVLCVLKVILDRGPGFQWGRFAKHLMLLVITSVLVFLPMVRYMYDEPKMYWYRVLTRTTGLETAMQESKTAVFLDNVKDALLMFNWEGDGVWVHSVPALPALDEISAALFVLGAAYVFYLLLVKRRPLALYLLVTVFIVLLPSTLSIAFPAENPSSLRASGVIPLMVVFVAMPVYLVGCQVVRALRGGTGVVLVSVLGGAMLLGAARLNYRTYFVDYYESYRQAAWNASDMARVIRGFGDSLGSIHDVYYVAIPYWIDHRATALMLGDMEWNNLTDTKQAEAHLAEPRNRLYMFHPTDSHTEQWLTEHYPDGRLMRFKSFTPEKDFMVFFAPARS